MAIKEVITLEGVEQVKAQLKDLGNTGEKSLKQFTDLGKPGGDTANPFDKLIENAKQAGLGLDDAGKHSKLLSETFHVLRPILNEAGASLGEFGAFSRIAGIGLIGLAAAITGTAAVALVRLSEETAKVHQRLNDLFQSSVAGSKAFEALKQSAENFGTTVKSLAPGFEGFVQAFNLFQERNRTFKFVALDPGDLPASVNAIDGLKKAFDALFATLRAGGDSEDQAKAAIATFNAEVAKTGQVTGQMVAALLKDAPGALKLLEQALGVPVQNAAALQIALDKLPVPFSKFVEGLQRIGPEAEKAFETKPIQTFAENLNASLATVQRSLEATSESVNKFGETSKTQIGGVFSDIAVDATGTLDTLKTTFAQPLTINTTSQQTFNDLVAAAQSAYQSIVSIFSTPIPVNFDARSSLQSTAPFASGGMVRGPGSGTSDSILAWLSNQEFVVNARAVSHYGPEFFAALNAMRLPRDFLSRFSMGGLARSLGGNRFAAGGQLRSGTPVVLNIDRKSFNMTAGDDTISQLKRFAVASQLSSTGRKPRWVK